MKNPPRGTPWLPLLESSTSDMSGDGLPADSFTPSEFWVRVQSRRRRYQQKHEVNLKTGL